MGGGRDIEDEAVDLNMLAPIDFNRRFNGNLRPLINVGCRTTLANADFEKLAPTFFLIFGKRGYVFKIIRKNTLPNHPTPGFFSNY